MHKLSQTCEQIAATTKKLEKERILSEYLNQLSDEDLSTACVFLSGTPFPLRDQRTTNAGFALLRDALADIVPDAVDRLGPVLLRSGDLGTAVEELFQGKTSPPTLTLKEILSYFEQLSSSSNTREKRALTADILRKATPVEAKYLIKILLGGMRIGLQESLVESSLAKAFHQPLKDVQRANMLLGDIGETAVLTRHHNLTQARMRLLHPLKPMLASPEEDLIKILEAMNGAGLAEDKYDGIRAQVHKQDAEIKIYSRDLDEITNSFPDVVNSLQGLSGSFVMDGEIVPYKNQKILSFGELQTRLGRKVLTSEILETVPCVYFAFDLLFHDAKLWMDEPLRNRRVALTEIYNRHPESFLLVEQKIVREAQEIEQAFEDSRARNNEGLVIKDPETLYTPGKRGKSWLKLKRAMITLDVVVTAAEYGHGKRKGLLSDYTFAVRDGNDLLTIGKAYSGITDKELLELSELFHRISIENRGFYHVVPPQLVLEVTFDRINKSNRHSSGFALRFPRIKRIRWDKKADEIDTLETVEKLFKEHFL
jgi:ATP-dependent DNA ligase I